jgi:co-chaperonin GroES (HSP10)
METDEALSKATASGIIIPKDKQCEATVIELGPSCWADSIDGLPHATVGDRVLLGKYVGIGIQGKDGLTYRLINDLDVVATLEVA